MKKKRTLLFGLVLVFLCLEIQGQTIKVKKGKVLWGKIPIATVENPYADHYEFANLAGEKIFSADLKGVSNGSAEIYHFLKIQSAQEEKTAQIEYEVLITSLKIERIIAYLLCVKYKVFTKNGIDVLALNQLFAKNNKDLEKKYASIVVASKQRDAERAEKQQEIRKRYYPQVQANNSIAFTQFGKMRIVGWLYSKPAQGITQTSEAIITLTDVDGNEVAFLDTGDRELASKNYNIKAWDGNNIAFNATRYYSKNNNAFLQELVIELILNGYLFEHQISKQKAALYKAKVDLAVANSSNIYWKPGLVLNKDGTKYNGSILVAFEKLDINQTGQNLPEYGADNFGAFLFVRYRNAKGKQRVKKIKAEQGVSFQVTVNNKLEHYKALKVKGELSKKLQNMNAFKFNSIYFYKLLKDAGTIRLYQDPAEQKKYVIKLAIAEKGQMIDGRSNSNLSNVVADYLQKCTSLSEEIRKGAFDLKVEENLYTIIEEYKNCN